MADVSVYTLLVVEMTFRHNRIGITGSTAPKTPTMPFTALAGKSRGRGNACGNGNANTKGWRTLHRNGFCRTDNANKGGKSG